MIHPTPITHTISSPVDLLKIIQQIELSSNHHLFYLGLHSPYDVANCSPKTALDVSRNPLIALFFACIDNSPHNGEIIIYHIPKQKISRALMGYDNDILVRTERGTFIFVNDQQHEASLLAKDKINQAPIEIIVNKDAKQAIILELEKLGVSMITLYPEMA
ncbi:hypothetical protein [Wohlfahrtiimonas larvae]|uniref:FRG domain-containing protein n=1 Tax=Wohlfahrtiimonas larvae TaxID=1157986 RepID=A0ABP9MTW8_9GAMM|nr:hypothetical protein [Wohlfahrtiimonas larvae]